jgi:hypothetical protein
MRSAPGIPRATIIAAALVLALACNRAPRDPVDHMLDALGGRDAIARLASLRVVADGRGPAGDFRTEMESIRPDSVVFRQSSARGTSAVGSGPRGAWATENGEAVSDTGAGRAFARGHEFHLLLFEIETRFSGHAPGGEEIVEGRPCARVTMTDENGQPAVLLVDRESGLPRLLELNPRGARGVVRVSFGDWRVIDGLRYFGAFTLTEGPNRAFTWHYTEIVPSSRANS